jgi:hypothetical protein
VYDAYCVDGLDKISLVGSDEVRLEKLKHFDKLVMEMNPCTGSSCVTDSNKIQSFFDKFWIELVMVYPQAKLDVYGKFPVHNIISIPYKA